MPFCTIVEFDFTETFGPDQLAAAMKVADEQASSPAGRLSLIRGADDKAGRIIEVWRSSADAQAFAEHVGPALPALPLPPPSRVSAFELTSYVVA